MRIWRLWSRVAQEHAGSALDTARKDLSTLAPRCEREIERARMNAEGEITAIQDQLVAQQMKMRGPDRDVAAAIWRA